MGHQLGLLPFLRVVPYLTSSRASFLALGLTILQSPSFPMLPATVLNEAHDQGTMNKKSLLMSSLAQKKSQIKE